MGSSEIDFNGFFKNMLKLYGQTFSTSGSAVIGYLYGKIG